MNKYNAHKEQVALNGKTYVFDSRKEAARFYELALREKAGEISGLQLQVEFLLIPSQKLPSGQILRATKYRADFVYKENGRTIVEDVKGYKRGQAYNVFKIKQKLMWYLNHIEVKEV